MQYQKHFFGIAKISLLLAFYLLACCSQNFTTKPYLKVGEAKDSIVTLADDVGEESLPSKAVLSELERESREVINQALEIFKTTKALSYLSNEVNEDSKAMEKWIDKTKTSQTRLGLLLKRHPRIFCLLVTVANRRIREASWSIPKNFKKFSLIWFYLVKENKCLVMVSPDDSCASIYGAAASSQEEANDLHVRIENIPKYFLVAQVTSQGYVKIDDKKILNEEPIMDTILSYDCPERFASIGSKGIMVNFTWKIIGQKRGYSPTGIRITSILNYDWSSDKTNQLECPKNIYGKPSWVCSTILLPQ